LFIGLLIIIKSINNFLLGRGNMLIDILNKKIGFGGIVSNIDLTKDLDKNIKL
jgi:hypothetical protein